MSLVYKLDVDDKGSAKIRKFGSEVDKAEKGTKQLDARTSELSDELAKIKADKLSSIRSGFTDLISPANLATAAFVAAGIAIGSMASEMLDSYDTAAKMARNTSIATEKIFGLRHAAELSGPGAEAMDAALQKLTMSIGKAAQGSGEAAPAFKEMGIELHDSNGLLKNADVILSEVADRFQGMGDSVDRGRLATQLFGESGIKMIDMLKDGSSGLKAMTDEGAAAAGNVEGLTSMIEDYNDTVTRGKAAAMGLMAVIADSAPFETAIGWVKNLSLEWMTFLKDVKTSDATEAVVAVGKSMDVISRHATSYYASMGNANASVQALKRSMEDAEAASRASGATELQVLSSRLAGINAAQDLIRTSRRLSEEEKTRRLSALEQERSATVALTSAARSKQKQDDDAAAASKKAEAEKQAALERTALRQKEAEKQAAAAAEAAKRRLEERRRLEESIAKEYESTQARMRATQIAAAQEAALDAQRRARGAQEVSEYEYNQLTTLDALRTSLATERMSQEQRESAVASQKYEQQRAELLAMHETELSLSSDKTATQRRQKDELAALENDQLTTQNRIKADADALAKEINDRELKSIEAKRDAQLSAAADNAAALQTLTKDSKKFRVAYKAGAMTEAGINAAQAVLKTMSATPFPWNVPLAIMQGAAGAKEVAKIATAKFYTGGMIKGKNTMIMTNEDGEEAVLSSTGVRAVGGPAGVAALNGGQANYNTSHYNNSSNRTVIVNVGMISQKTLNDQVFPAMREANYRY